MQEFEGGGSATENKGVQEFTGTLQREMRLHKNLLWDLQREMASCKNLLGCPLRQVMTLYKNFTGVSMMGNQELYKYLLRFLDGKR
jgi:hypothetical protein